MLQRAKEVAFFIGVFVLVVYALSFLSPDTTSEPPTTSLKELLAPYIPGAIAILKGLLLAIVITAAAIIVGLLVIPVRNWLKYQMEQYANELDDSERETVAREIRINGQGYQVREKPVAAPDHRIQKALQEKHLLYTGLLSLLRRYDGNKERSTLEPQSHELIGELERVLERLKWEASHKAPQSALNGPSWQDVARVVAWARSEPAMRLRATRDVFRAIGVQVPDADLQPGGTFNEWVRGLNVEPTPSPIAPIATSVNEKQAKSDAGRVTDAPRTANNRPAMGRSQPRKRRG